MLEEMNHINQINLLLEPRDKNPIDNDNSNKMFFMW